MKEQFFVEVRENWKKIRQMEEGKSEEEKEAARAGIRDTLIHLFRLTQFAKKEGVLSLENELDDMQIQEQYEKDMIKSIVNGLDMGNIEELYLLRYLSEDMNPYQALSFLYFLWGIISLCRGRYVGSIKSQFSSWLPQDMKILELFEEEKDEELMEEIDFESQKFSEKVDKQVPEIDAEMRKALMQQMCEAGNPLKHGDIGFTQMKALEILLEKIGSNGIRKLAAEISNNEWATAMNGLSGKSRKLILDNLPDEEVNTVIDLCDNRYPDRSLIVGRLRAIIETIKRLVDNAVIDLDKKYFNLFDYI